MEKAMLRSKIPCKKLMEKTRHKKLNAKKCKES
jgi:hypothetical protein